MIVKVYLKKKIAFETTCGIKDIRLEINYQGRTKVSVYVREKSVFSFETLDDLERFDLCEKFEESKREAGNGNSIHHFNFLDGSFTLISTKN